MLKMQTAGFERLGQRTKNNYVHFLKYMYMYVRQNLWFMVKEVQSILGNYPHWRNWKTGA